MQSNNNPERIALGLIIILIALCVLTGCSSVPDVCQAGVPTSKNCFTVQGNRGAFGFGPINIITAKF